MSLIPIVDADDNIIEYKMRGSLELTDRYRVSALWVTNTQWEILLAQRHRTKKHHPLLWWPAVAGTVEKDETYESNIIKETEEEIGVSWIVLVLGPKTQTKSGYLHFTQWFTSTIDLPINDFRIKEDELESLRWITPENLKREFSGNPTRFVPSFSYILPIFL